MKDFFARYREFHKNPVIVPALFGMALSFAIVANMQGTPIDLKSISANVVSGIEEQPSYPADLIMEQSGKVLSFTLGKNAENVKSIHFSVLGNPAVFLGALSNDSNTTISMNEPGVALVRVNTQGSIQAGTKISEITTTLS